jgi:hypothetical protein
MFLATFLLRTFFIVSSTIRDYSHIQKMLLFLTTWLSATEMHTPLLELVRLVRLYSEKWGRKSEAIGQIHNEYDKNKRHLDVALRRISVTGLPFCGCCYITHESKLL